jgi:hypothetical protein
MYKLQASQNLNRPLGLVKDFPSEYMVKPLIQHLIHMHYLDSFNVCRLKGSFSYPPDAMSDG